MNLTNVVMVEDIFHLSIKLGDKEYKSGDLHDVRFIGKFVEKLFEEYGISTVIITKTRKELKPIFPV